MMDISRKLILQDRANIMPSSGVRRALFNCNINHSEIKTSLKQKMDEIHQESKERWNFDFEEEKPLAGSYDWQEVKMDEEVPVCYQREYTRKNCHHSPQRIQKLPKYSSRFNPLFSPKKLVSKGISKRRSSCSTMKSLGKLKSLPLNETKAAALVRDSDSDSDSDADEQGFSNVVEE